jgi:predicted nucleic acid-binding Zn ribbon protein
MEKKQCLMCGEPIKGRRDKRFCDDQCRNAHYNEQHCNELQLMRNVHNILRRNRKLLESFFTNGQHKCKVRFDHLQHLGFSFRFHTHVELKKDGQPLYFCYEYGYQQLDSTFLMLYKKEIALAA